MARFTLFDGAKGIEPKRDLKFTSMKELADAFSQPSTVSETKEDVALFSRGYAFEGRKRNDIQAPFSVILDIDQVTIDIEGCSARLRKLGIAHVGHTTWSHDPSDFDAEEGEVPLH